MKRRAFLTAFAALPALTVLAGAALRLPKRELDDGVALNSALHPMEGDFDIANLRAAPDERMSKYFTSPDTWYLKTEHEDGVKRYYRPPSTITSEEIENGDYEPAATLSEESLEQLCIDIADQIDARGNRILIRSIPRKAIYRRDLASDIWRFQGLA